MKKIILLFGYIAGVIVGSKFAAKRKSSSTKETLGDFAKDAGEEILSVHKRLLDKAKKEYWTEENKQFVFEKKDALMMFVEDFKSEAKDKLDELKEAGTELTSKGEEELRKIYENRSEYLKKASKLGKEALASAQDKLDEVFDELQTEGGKKIASASKKFTKKKVGTSKSKSKTKKKS